MMRFLISIIVITIASPLLAAELVLSYDFEGNTTDVVTDKSGNGVNGVLREFNVSGQAFYQNTGFNGSRCLVTNASMSTATNKGRGITYLPAGFTFENEVTFVLRLKRYPTIQGITLGAESVSVPLGWYTDAANSVRGLYVRNSVHSTGAPVDSVMLFEYDEWLRYPNIILPPDGQWHFVVVRLSSSLGIYVRVDDSVYTNITDKRSIGNCAILMLGNRLQVDNPFCGEFDDIRVYKGAMTDTEILSIYQSMKASSPTPYNGEVDVDPNLLYISWVKPEELAVNVYLDDDPDLSDALFLSNVNSTEVQVSLELDKDYYWRVDVIGTDNEVKTGELWIFQTKSSCASEQYPADASKGVPFDVRLRWKSGFGAESHKIYISDSRSVVENRTVNPIITSDITELITGLDSYTTYYWAVDEVAGSDICFGSIIEFQTHRDLQSDTWMASDALGRELPGYDECGQVRSDKTIGVFYFLWHDSSGRIVYDITNLFEVNPDDPSWGGRNLFHYWGEPEMGYYLGTDPYVLRRHASMLNDAGVDMVFFDVGNALVYTPVYLKLCEVWQQMRNEGQTTPQICFQARAASVATVQKLYDEFYSRNLYTELWYYWQDKPLMLSPLTGHSQEVRDFFTMRDSWAWQSGQYKWTWLDHYPQRYGWDLSPSVPEQTSVCIAQHATSNIGRSFQAAEVWGGGTQPAYDQWKLTGTEHLGLYFDQQWQKALAIDPAMLFITGWNEWIAQRFICGQDACQSFLGSPTSEGDSYFVDLFNQEYSRDAEPMKDGHTDNYYYQMIAGIRKYKGVSKPPVADEPKKISIDGDFGDWNDVTLTYYDTVNDTFHRDWPGCSGYYYTDTSGRNDIIESKVAFDAYQIYFYVETAQQLTSHTDDNWMLLFLNTDQNNTTGWHGYDYLVNRYRSDTTVVLEKWCSGFIWEPVANLPYSYMGSKMEMAIPRTFIGKENQKDISFDFHWADNIEAGNGIIEFAVSGDSAPNRRFNYRYQKVTPATYFEQDGNFEGWAMTNNLSNANVSDGVLSFNVTGADSYMINWRPVNVGADTYRYIHIRMKNQTSSSIAQFYWTTATSSIMDDNKHIDFQIYPNDTEFRDYWIDMSEHPYWNGTIRLLRFDPSAASAGYVEIDFVRLEDRLPVCGDMGYMASDINRDCTVGFEDLVLMASNWLSGY